MNTIQSTHAKQDDGLSSALVFLLALGAGLAAASIYYSQPLLGVLGTDLQTSAAAVGWVPTLTQLGYALGILLLAPLGDRYDRRRVIAIKAGLLAAALLLSSLSPTLGVLLVASLALGLVATLAQDIVPAAATLAPETRRGRVVGTVMTGLLLGILLSRVVSGFVAEHFGWRTVFAAAAVAVLLLGLALWRVLPPFAPTSRLPYGQLIGSLLQLWRQHPELRRAALAQGLLSVAFSGFWSTMAVMLHGAPYHLGTSAAGAFGLAGAAGALAAPLAGRYADRHGPARVSLAGAALTALSFAAMFFLPALSPHHALWLIAASTVGFDLGIQVSLIAHQTIVYGLDPAARSRLNAVLLSSTFVGMSMGAALGNALLAQAGWTGVTALAVMAALGAWALRLQAPAQTRQG
ncbi:MFS transporter [Hylemonella gracilis]|uniref:Major facilitator superfamily permease n=1 Tax=Hylemonella gracilis ATCC 19624 TaxID=887062 RepID=F3KTV3_9BURK|nr:MFS transporter [Hylemonella gracilis]EGI76781.1 major facilitator superfamily permease [Hylemonella gracilis ATCC 19624]